MSVEQIFFEECDECLAAAEAALETLARADGNDPEAINTVFRAVHSIKGGGGAFGFDRLVAFTHAFETALDRVRSGEIAASAPALMLFQRCRDMLEDHVEAVRTGAPAPDDARLLALLTSPGDAEQGIEADASNGQDFGAGLPGPRRLRMRPDARALRNGGEPLNLLRELVHLGATDVTLDCSRLPPFAELDPAESYLAWQMTLPGTLGESEVLEIFEFSGDEIAVEITAGCEPVAVGSSAPDDHHPLEAPSPAAGEAQQVQLAAATADTAPDTPPIEAPLATVCSADVMAPSNAEPATQRLAPVAAIGAAKSTPQAEFHSAEPSQGRAVRVDLDRVDRVVNLVGELVITQAMLAERIGDRGRPAQEALGELADLTRELQDSVMAMRAQPIRIVFSRIPRLIRELEAISGKRIVLETFGEATEVDKTVVERLGEPLTHMIRNAVDHGIEPPAERLARGKSEAGTIRLSAEHRGSRIVITVADDGRGIDRARVRQRAVDRGLIAADQSLTEEEIDNLIFMPGFSTAATVSSISGRGVGMDVVRKSVQALGGRVQVQTRSGLGTTISLTLPLTLAILDGMIVTVGEATYVLPIGCIIEIIRPSPKALKPLGPTGMLLDVRGVYVPVVRVAEALGIRAQGRAAHDGILLLVESERLGRAALLVDEIRDQKQIVIKSLEQNYGNVADVAGATILGDGRVALILDVEEITARATSAGTPQQPRISLEG